MNCLKKIFWFASIITLANSHCFSLDQQPQKGRMLADLETIKYAFEIQYAPAKWKKEFAQWELEQAFWRAKEKITKAPSLSTKDFRNILKEFMSSTRDYHVQISFLSTEAASLPFSVKSVNGNYFIDQIDTTILSPSLYYIQKGDEVVYFDGRPVAAVVADLKANLGRKGNELTDQAVAEITLTSRKAAKGDEISKNPITVSFRSSIDGLIRTYQLAWEYTSERIKNPSDKLSNLLSLKLGPNDHRYKAENSLLSLNMLNPLSDLIAKEGGLGAFRSYVPQLGSAIWTGTDETFNAYIYVNEHGNRIGYIRIPHYRLIMNDLQNFGKLIADLQANSDALVIDQVCNPGGYVSYVYCLASFLSSTPLATPKHRLALTQDHIFLAFEEYDLLKKVQSDEDAAQLSDQFFNGDPCLRTYQSVLFMKDFLRFMINEWNEGRTLTDPTYLGIDHINPNPIINYTKPILILIDHLDFSGGDFFPAIMQDNKRAKLFGTRTAGAGGCVVRHSFPNMNGIAGFTLTQTIAERANPEKKPIENLGVMPDIEYRLNEDDLRYDYQYYGEAVNQTIQAMIEESSLDMSQDTTFK